MAEEQDLQESQKDVAFYSAVVEAWVATRMEKDRTLLTLASAGIGLLATLLTTVGPGSLTELVLYGAAGTAFTVSVVAAVSIFGRNSDHLEAVVQERKRGNDPKLQRLDRLLFVSFLLGVILTGAIAMSSGYARIRKERSMSQGDRETTKGTGGSEQRSLTGIGNLAPITPSAQPAGSGNAQGTGSGTQGGGGASSGSGASNQDPKK